MMYNYQLILGLTLTIWIGSISAMGTGLLFKHMANNGDTEFTPICDDCYNEMSMQNSYRVFNQGYTKTFIGSNGYLTFENGYTAYDPWRTSAFSGPIMVAPYWSDNYPPENIPRSHIWYREETSDQTQLNKARDVIQAQFATCGGSDFVPTGLVIATWSRLAPYCDYYGFYYYWGYDCYYKKRSSETSKRDVPADKSGVNVDPLPGGKLYGDLPQNSYQAVLATDGCQTYAIFNMHTIEWDCCWSMNQMSFNDGNDVAYYRNPEDDLVHNTNAGLDGRWVYKISGAHIIGPDCSQLGS